MFKPYLQGALTALTVLALVLGGFGCHSSTNTSPTTPSTSAPPGTTTPQTSTSPATATGNLSVHFIDVGQGDAILIDYGTVEVLIDGGDRSPGVATYLRQYVDGDLDVMIATHPHADHIGGLIAVLDAFKVDNIWTNGDTATSATYNEFMSKVAAEGATVRQAKRGDTIVAGTLNFIVISPALPLGSDTNENSIVLRLVYGSQAFLFMGDAGKPTEAAILAAGLVVQAQVLKVGHHGSSSASSPAFLNAVKPEAAVYMAKTGNSYGHPHQVTIDALNQVGAVIYGTDTLGTIVLKTDGQTRISKE